MSYSLTVDWARQTVAVLTFSDPVRRNQLCWAAVDELGAQLQHCREAGARVIILASSLEGHWLEHAWLRDLSNSVQGGEQTGPGVGWFSAQQELGHEDIVSIAAVSGDCSGGGAEMGWACDIRIAEAQARFAQPEVNMGLTTGIGGCSRLTRLVGRATTTEMVLTGRPLSARRLYELGAISQVVDKGQALPAALALAERLAAKPAAAVAGLKRILSVADDSPLSEALEREQKIFGSVLAGDQALTGMEQMQAQYDSGASTADLNDYEKWQKREASAGKARLSPGACQSE